jgi:polyisoprenoid-binding protein YceI
MTVPPLLLEPRSAKRVAQAAKHLLLAAVLVCGLFDIAAGEERIALDQRQLSIGFEVQSLGFWRIAGRFSEAWGEVAFNPKEPIRSRLKVVASTSSISTASVSRDGHLRSVSFFDVGRHPILTFESTRIELTDQSAGIVTGNLSMLGVTRPIELTFRLRDQRREGAGHKSIRSQRFQASGVLRRSEWGMTALIPAISDEVRLEIEANVRD